MIDKDKRDATTLSADDLENGTQQETHVYNDRNCRFKNTKNFTNVLFTCK